MPPAVAFAAPIFAFGLVAFGFLGMGPVTIAVDSFGPVTDNAQSVYELSQIEQLPGCRGEIERDFGFAPDFEHAKLALEKGDGAGNTFKATAKPVLIGTAVVGATTMVFGIILLLDRAFGGVVDKLSLVHPAGRARPASPAARSSTGSPAPRSRPSSPAPTARSSTSSGTSASTPPPPRSATPRRSSASAPSTPSAA